MVLYLWNPDSHGRANSIPYNERDVQTVAATFLKGLEGWTIDG